MTNQEAIEVMFNEWKCIDRNDGIHCDRKCESCDLVMDVGIIREAFNMAISALQAQEAKTQLSAEGTTSDLISRQEAIDAPFKKYDMSTGVTWIPLEYIEQLPSAQPERKTGWWLIREGISDAQCSECKMYFRDVYDMDNSDAFCRHCGAKMEGLKVVEDE